MFYKTVAEKVRAIVDSCENEKLEFSKGTTNAVAFTFNQQETVRRINYYINSKYLARDDNAVFWNIINPRITHFAKNIDLDTKDLMPYGIGEVNFYDSWRARIMFRRWLDENEMAILLNDLSEGLATYGSMIWKRYIEDGKTKVKELRLDNAYFDQSLECIDYCDFVEMHHLTANELWEKEDIWDNVKEVLKKQTRNERIDIWEFWGWHQDDEDSKPYMIHEIGFGEGDDYVCLWKDTEITEKDFPYYDFHIGRYRGRWLRTGVAERLFTLQERANTVVNENAQATSIASLLLLRSSDPSTNGSNVLEQAMSGQIITSDDLQQIAIDNRAFTILLNELKSIEAQANNICLTPDVIMGDPGPSGTPFRSTALMSNAAKSTFSYIKQRVGEKVGYILGEYFLPELKKEWNKQDILEITESEEDFKIYDEQVFLKAKIELLARNLQNGVVTTDQDLAALQSKVESEIPRIGRRLVNEKGSFNFKFGIKFNVTGESVDRAQQNDAYSNIITWKLQNPAIGADPYFRQYVENNGITPIRMGTKELQDQTAQMQQGAMAGGTNASQVAKPNTDPMAAMVDTKQ